MKVGTLVRVNDNWVFDPIALVLRYTDTRRTSISESDADNDVRPH